MTNEIEIKKLSEEIRSTQKIMTALVDVIESGNHIKERISVVSK